MENISQEDTHYHDIQGTIIVPITSQAIQKTPKKSKRKPHSKVNARVEAGGYREAQQSSFNDPHPKQQLQIQDGERNSENKMRGPDEETMGEVEDNGLAQPYQFLSQRNPSILSIFFPRFTVKSITFWLSVFYVLMFAILLGYNYSRTQTDITWNCSLFRLQAKYYPKLRYGSQIWRVVTSAFFHSNLAHFFLDLFALQVYGYFVEWSYGKAKYAVTIALAAIYAHFLSALAQKTSISTTPSALLFAVLALKIFFLWQYRAYRKLLQRRSFLYILLALIAGINLIPIFVVNNVDFSAHLGGAIIGFGLGLFFYLSKQEDQTITRKFLRGLIIFLLIASFALIIALVFNDSSSEYQILSETIDSRCN